MKNFNTIEDFKNADKRALFNQLADEVRPLPYLSLLILTVLLSFRRSGKASRKETRAC